MSLELQILSPVSQPVSKYLIELTFYMCVFVSHKTLGLEFANLTKVKGYYNKLSFAT